MTIVNKIDDGRFRIENISCPQCDSTLTRVVDGIMIACLSCGNTAYLSDCPDVVKAVERIKRGEC